MEEQQQAGQHIPRRGDDVEKWLGLWRNLQAGQHIPRRGDDVEKWLGLWRDLHSRSSGSWSLLDQLLHDYQAHADAGTPLDAAPEQEQSP